jgi:hypothetical protein
MNQVVECSTRKHKALTLIPSTRKREKERRVEERERGREGGRKEGRKEGRNGIATFTA